MLTADAQLMRGRSQSLMTPGVGRFMSAVEGRAVPGKTGRNCLALLRLDVRNLGVSHIGGCGMLHLHWTAQGAQGDILRHRPLGPLSNQQRTIGLSLLKAA